MNEDNTVTVRAQAESIAQRASPDAIADLMRLALDKQVSVEALEKLVALHERVADRMARQEFANALARFQRACPPIPRGSTAQIVTKSGARFSYQYAELDQIATTIAPLLHPLGLSYTWDSSVKDGVLICVCTLRHVNGHSITASFAAPTETAAGMSEAQKCAAALTFARRQTLISILGLTTAETDTDGADPGGLDLITETQAADLEALIGEVGADHKRFLAYLKVGALAEIRQRDYKSAIAALEAKRRKA